MEKEKYVGGIRSSKFKKRKQFSIGGYGIYVTDKRLFGVKGSLKESLKDAAKGSLLDILILPNISLSMTAQQVTKAIEELENKKDIEMIKENISQIELKKPSALGFRGGRLEIRTKDGKSVQISFPYMTEFKKLKNLMETFAPELLKII